MFMFAGVLFQIQMLFGQKHRFSGWVRNVDVFKKPSSGQHPIATKIAHVQKYVQNMSHIFVINGDKKLQNS